MSLSVVDVVLPCLNEQAALPGVLAGFPAGYRAIVVDNGSTDGSARVAEAHGARVVFEPRRGFGAAAHAGLLAATAPIESANPDQILHVRFGGAPADQLVRAMETFRQLVRERPGETRVVVHIPAPGGSALPMQLKQAVAYDADLLAEVQRRLGTGIAQVSLA